MSNSAAEAEITAVYWNNIVGSSLTGNLLYIGVLASADERPGITMLGASNNNMIVGNEVGCNTHGGFQANGINYQTGTAYHTTTGNVFQGCKISLLYDAGASKNLDASNVNINGTYVTDNGTANNHDWVDTAGLYRSSYKYFDAGLQGGAVKITANVNGGIVMGASGKAPFLDFVCDGRSFCGRLQQVGAGAIEFETTTGPLGGTFVDGTAGGTPVNQIRITSTATGVAPTVLGAGTDATVDLSLGCQNHGSCAVKIPNDPLNIAVPITGNGIQLGAWLYQTNNINSVGVDLSASFDHGLAIGWNQAGNGEVNYVASSTVANTWSHRFQSWFGSTLKLAPVNASYFQTSNIVTVTDATYTVDVALDYAIIGNRAGTITLTLPNPVTYPGRSLEIKTIQAQTIVSNASNVVPVDGGGAGTAIIAATAGKWAILRSNGTSWIIMASN
jgi:hypothetical protein